MEQLISENESHKFEVHRLKDNKAELKKTVSLLETSEAEKVRAIEDLMNIKEDLKIQNKVWLRSFKYYFKGLRYGIITGCGVSRYRYQVP